MGGWQPILGGGAGAGGGAAGPGAAAAAQVSGGGGAGERVETSCSRWRGNPAQPNPAGGPGPCRGTAGEGGRGPASRTGPDPGSLSHPWASAGAGPAQVGDPTWSGISRSSPAPPGASFPGEICRTSWTGPGSHPLDLRCWRTAPFSLLSAQGSGAQAGLKMSPDLGAWAASGGALAVPCITFPELACCPPRLHGHCPSCCFQALKDSWHLQLAAGSGSGQEGQAHRMSGDQEGSPEGLRGHLLRGQKTEALREGVSGSLWSVLFLRPGMAVSHT